MSIYDRQSKSEADREAMIEWARAAITDPYTLFLDTETTGFPPKAEVVDIAIIDSAGTVLLDTLVRPRFPIPARASRVHGIHDRHVEHAPRWPEVFEQLCQVVEHRTVVVYNAEFDSAVLKTATSAEGLSFPSVHWDCAMHAYSAFVGHPSGRRRGGYRWFKLDEAARACEIEPGGHRARADAETCRRVVEAMAKTPVGT